MLPLGDSHGGPRARSSGALTPDSVSTGAPVSKPRRSRLAPLASPTEVRALHVRPPPKHGLPALSASEVLGIQRRFVLESHERVAWGAVFARVRRASGVVAAIDRADREIRFLRGDRRVLSLSERQIDLLEGRV